MEEISATRTGSGLFRCAESHSRFDVAIDWGASGGDRADYWCEHGDGLGGLRVDVETGRRSAHCARRVSFAVHDVEADGEARRHYPENRGASRSVYQRGRFDCRAVAEDETGIGEHGAI